jgi:hypothetical protein
MQAVRNERDRAEQQAADNLRNHHEAAQRDNHPRAALVLFVAFAEKNMVMGAGKVSSMIDSPHRWWLT